MSVSKQQSEEFLSKMKEKAAQKQAAPLALVKDTQASVPAAAVAVPEKKKGTFVERTMSFKLAEADYDAIEEIIFKRRKAGEKSFNNKTAGREMVALWLQKHGAESFKYDE